MKNCHHCKEIYLNSINRRKNYRCKDRVTTAVPSNLNKLKKVFKMVIFSLSKLQINCSQVQHVTSAYSILCNKINKRTRSKTTLLRAVVARVIAMDNTPPIVKTRVKVLSQVPTVSQGISKLKLLYSRAETHSNTNLYPVTSRDQLEAVSTIVFCSLNNGGMALAAPS
jgi:hypothetical protein